MTSVPMAFSMTWSVKSLTTLKLTSASSSAVRTSRIDSRMFSSLMRPRPERERKTPVNLSVSASNMRPDSLAKRRIAVAAGCAVRSVRVR